MKIKKVAIFQLDNYRLSPFSRHLYNIASEFKERGIALDLIVSSSSGMDSLPENVRVHIIGRRWPKLRRAPRHYLGIPDLVNYLKEQRPDALIARGVPFAVSALLAKRLAGSKAIIIMTLHYPLTAAIEGRMYRSRVILPYLARYAINRCDHTIAVSRGVADDYTQCTGGAIKKIGVIYNPVVNGDLLKAAEEPVDDPWFRGDRSHKTLLSVGRLAPEKDYPTLLKMLALLRRTLDVRLVIIGDGVLRNQLSDLSSQLGLTEAVRFIGRKDNPYAYMSKADAFILTSEFEGLPGVLIQAMAVGCPVVSTDCKFGPREILEEGKWGPLCPVGDDECLASAAASVLQNPIEHERLVMRGQAFSASESVNQFLQLIYPSS